MDMIDYLINPDNYGGLTHSQISELYEKLLGFNYIKEMTINDWIKNFKLEVKRKYYVLNSTDYVISEAFDIEVISYSNTFCILKSTIKCRCVSNFDDDRIIPKAIYEMTLDGIIEIR